MTVYQHNGIWRYRFMLGGQRYFGTLPDCNTERQAKNAEAEARVLARQGKLDRPDRKTKLVDFAREKWLPWSKDNHVAAHYYENNRLLEKVIAPFFGARTFAEISSLLIESFKSQRRKTPTRHGKPRSAQTLVIELNTLSSIFALAVKAKIITENPCSAVERPVVDNERERVLSADEEDRLFAVLTERHGKTNNHLLPLVTLAIHTGLRKTELFRLRRDEVDFERGEIRIAGARVKGKRTRRVKINPIARQVLLEQLSSHDHEYVFVSARTGRPYRDVKNAWQSALRAAGIADFHWHDLRAEFATRLVEAGATQVDVQKLLGHRNTKTTDRYTRGRNERLSSVVASLAERRKAS